MALADTTITGDLRRSLRDERKAHRKTKQRLAEAENAIETMEKEIADLRARVGYPALEVDEWDF